MNVERMLALADEIEKVEITRQEAAAAIRRMVAEESESSSLEPTSNE